MSNSSSPSMANFYPRSPCGERRSVRHRLGLGKLISIHALLAESDESPALAGTCAAYFYPRSPCGERRASASASGNWIRISIHALLAESDLPWAACAPSNIDFYPRSPCGERPVQVVVKIGQRQFLSTLSLRRATFGLCLKISVGRDFYPRSPCGERLCGPADADRIIRISIHALLAESDAPSTCTPSARPIFLSTLSLRRATFRQSCRTLPTYTFLSTLSLRRATIAFPSFVFYVLGISIHALLAESDVCLYVPTLQISYFYPRSPCGERLLRRRYINGMNWISIHALLAESDASSVVLSNAIKISIHALLAESD